MISFILKGILRDKSRSWLPILVITIGVMLTVSMIGYINGAFRDLIDQNARFDTGHVKIMTRAYYEKQDQIPNDLALLEVTPLVQQLQKDFPGIDWVQRIKFGGLLDVADDKGESRMQGNAIGLAYDLLSPGSSELERMKIASSIVSGQVLKQPGEAIIGHEFAERLQIKPGDSFTFFGSTMEGSMAFKAFKLAGTIRYGSTGMDKTAIIVDLKDAQYLLDMEDGTGELLGFQGDFYDNEQAISMATQFNAKYVNDKDQFAPTMITLKAQNGLGELINHAESMTGGFIFLFVLAMSIVLWNTGLLGGLRRYKEFGIRLALGEGKSRIYLTNIAEAVIIGLIGSVIGTILGLAISYYMQEVGIDVSAYLQESSMIMPTIIRSRITPDLFYIGFIPGVLAMVFGTMLAGRAIYKRETARLFKELEV